MGVIAGTITRLYFVNKDIKVTKENYKINEQFRNDNVLYKVAGYSITEYPEFDEYYVLEIRLNVQNDTNTTQECDFTNICLDYNDSCINISMDAFITMPTQDAGLCTITPPGDKFDIVLPYLISKKQLGSSNTIDIKKAALVFSLYPIKKYVDLSECYGSFTNPDVS